MKQDPKGQGVSRRDFFSRVGDGLHGAALAPLLASDLYPPSRALAATAEPSADPAGLQPRKSHFESKAKSVIHLFMNGGPSQVDLFDPKPMLDSRIHSRRAISCPPRSNLPATASVAWMCPRSSRTSPSTSTISP